MRLRFLSISSCFIVSLMGCSEKAAEPSSETPGGSALQSAQLPDEPIDACKLLTSEEIQAVEGEAMAEAKADRTAENGFVISQCYFSLPTFANSLTVRLVQKGSGSDAQDPKQVWQETVARNLEKALEQRKKAPPERVHGLGDEAFWLGGPVAGGLYVLEGNRYFRIGLGGEANQERKIEKATRLARSILQRL